MREGTFVGGVGDTFHNGFPFEDLGFGDGAEEEEERRGVVGLGLEFVEEAFCGWGGGGAGGGGQFWGMVAVGLDVREMSVVQFGRKFV